jgi:WD40 repeat protein
VIGDFNSSQIELYDDEKRLIKTSNEFHTNGIPFLKYLSNGFVAMGSQGITVYIWDPITLKSLITYSEHEEEVSCLDQINAETIVSASYVGNIRIWSANSGLTFYKINAGKSVYFVRVLWNRAQILCGLFDGMNNLIIYNYTNNSLVTAREGRVFGVNSLEILNEPFVASVGSSDPRVIVWDLNTYAAKSKLAGHSAQVTCIKLISSNMTTMASGDAAGLIIIWNWMQETRLHTLNGHTERVTSLDLFDQRTLISGSLDGTIKFWNISNGQLQVRLVITSLVERS